MILSCVHKARPIKAAGKSKKTAALNRSSSSFRFNESWYRQAVKNKVIFVTLKLIKKTKEIIRV